MAVTPPAVRVGCWSVGSSSGVGVVDVVGLAGGAGPSEVGGGVAGVGPVAVGLHAVVESAERVEVCGGRCPAGVVRGDVVEVAAPGGAGAVGEDAGGVGQDDVFALPVGGLVAGGGDLLGEVEDGSDGDLGGDGAAPVPELLDGGVAEALDAD